MNSDYDEGMPMKEVVDSFLFWNTVDDSGIPRHLITPEIDYLKGILDFSKCLREFSSNGKFVRISATQGSKRVSSRIEVPSLVRDLIQDQITKLEYWRSNFGGCSFNPMIETYIKVVHQWSERICRSQVSRTNEEDNAAYVREINGFLDDLYARLNDSKTTRSMHNHVRSAKKNFFSVCDYIGNMFRKYSRVLAIRIDLSYGKYDPRQGINTQGLLMTGRLTHHHVKLHREQFLRALRSRYGKGWVGYVWKLEYTYLKGFHYHMFVFLNGNMHQQDVSLAQEMGEIWQQSITKGMGQYFNCNAKKETYGAKNATGMIRHDSGAKINNLKRAIGYLIKIDELVRMQTQYDHRIFGKSVMPEVPILPRGRKRSLVENFFEMAHKNGHSVKNLKRGLTPVGLKRPLGP